MRYKEENILQSCCVNCFYSCTNNGNSRFKTYG